VLLKGGSTRFGGSLGSGRFRGSFNTGKGSIKPVTRSYGGRSHGTSYYGYYTYPRCYGSCSRYRRPYTFRYQPLAAQAGRRIVTVGCYFWEASCFECPNCYKQPSRESNPANLAWEFAFPQARDIYELDTPFQAPGSKFTAKWPLQTKLRGFVLYRPLVTEEGGVQMADRNTVVHVSFGTGEYMNETSYATRMQWLIAFLILGCWGWCQGACLFLQKYGDAKQRAAAEARRRKRDQPRLKEGPKVYSSCEMSSCSTESTDGPAAVRRQHLTTQV